MPKWGYSILPEALDPEKTAKASGREVKVSHKHAREVCRTIKGMTLTNAKAYLRDVTQKKKPVPFTRYNKKAGHRHGLPSHQAASGRYPIKAAQKSSTSSKPPKPTQKTKVSTPTAYEFSTQQRTPAQK